MHPNRAPDTTSGAPGARNSWCRRTNGQADVAASACPFDDCNSCPSGGWLAQAEDGPKGFGPQPSDPGQDPRLTPRTYFAFFAAEASVVARELLKAPVSSSK